MTEILAFSGGPDGPGRRARRTPWRARLYVVHVNVGPEVYGRSAEDLARYCAAPHPDDYPAYQVMHDDDSDVIGARDWERVNGAGSVAEFAYHACIVGRADQTTEQWADDFSIKAIARSAAWARAKCAEIGIPVRKIGPTEILAGEAGICGHHDVTLAYPRNNAGHYDPGPHFPWGRYLELASGGEAPLAPEPVYGQEDDGVTIIWYGGYPHCFWIDGDGDLQHDYGQVENMCTRYGVHETFDPLAGVAALVAPDGALHVRTVTSDGRAIRWGFSGKGWGANAAVPV